MGTPVTRAAGLDVSFTRTGVAVACDTVTVRDVRGSGPTPITLTERALRLSTLTGRILEALPDDVTHVAIEGPAFDQVTGKAHERGGLWWTVVRALLFRGIDVVEIGPTVLKKYATERGNAGKDEVLAAVVRRFPDVDVANNDQADALVLAAMLARHLGQPFDLEPSQKRRDALDGVLWWKP